MSVDNSAVPAAYRRGWVDFYGRRFAVDPRVLIPRPETEQMVDIVLNLAGKAYLPGVRASERVLPEHPVITDVGTGSGCVAITLALELPECQITGVDISPEALEVAQENAMRLGATGVELLRSDLLECYGGTAALEAPDVIVANLPYVSREWAWIGSELEYEPSKALFAADGGLEIIKRLIRQIVEQRSRSQAWQEKTQFVVLEADPCQHTEIVEFAAAKGLKSVRIAGFQLLFTLTDSYSE